MHYKKIKRKNSFIGFYVAVGVCIIAIGIAAAASYKNVKKVPIESGSSSEISTVSDSNKKSSAKATSEKNKSASQSYGIIKEKSDDKTKETTEDTSDESPDPENSDTIQTEASISDDVLETWSSDFSATIPVGGSIIKNFSGNDLLYSETMRDYRAHKGIDISASKGDTVHAISDGTVLDIKKDDLLGNVIVIEHSGYEVSYCGLGATALVHIGDTVKLGEDIGSVLDVPCEIIEQAHLHIEIKKDGEYIDPLSLIA